MDSRVLVSVAVVAALWLAGVHWLIVVPLAAGAAWLHGSVAHEEIEDQVQAAVKNERERIERSRNGGKEAALQAELAAAAAEKEALTKRVQALSDTATSLEKENEALAREKEAQKKLRGTLNETIVDKQETIERMRAEAETAAKEAASEVSRRAAELAAQQSMLAAVEQNAVALRLELEMERIGRASAEKTALSACEKADIVLTEAEAQRVAQATALQALEAEHARVKSEHAAATRGFEAELAKAKNAIECLQKQLDDSRSDAEAVRVALEHAKSEPERARGALLKQLQEAHADTDAVRRQLEAAQNAAAERAAETETALAGLREQVAQGSAETAALQSRVEMLQGQLEQKERELESLRRSVVDAQKLLSEAHAQAGVSRNALIDAMTDLQSEMEKDKAALAGLREEVAKTCSQMDDLRVEASFWRAESDTRKQSVLATEERAEGLRAELERARQQPSAAEVTETRKRENIIDELVKTETHYVADLGALDEVVLMPLRAGAVFKVEKAAKLFKQEELDAMMRASMQLLSGLQKRPDCLTVAKVFTTFVDVALASYSSYCSGTFSALTELFLKNSNAKWIAFRKKVEGNPRLRGLPLDAVFIKPVQRLCKYPLLLVELRKHTAPQSVENVELAKVIEKLNKAIGHINAIRRESELLHRAVEIEQGGVHGVPSGFWSSNPERRLLREESMMLITEHSKPTRVMCWMFSDCVIFAKRAKLRITSSQLYSAVVPPIFFSVTLLLNDVPDDAEKGLSNAIEFSFESAETKERALLILMALTREVKLEWMQAIRGICEKMVVLNPRPKRDEKSASATTVVMNPLKRFGVSMAAPSFPPAETEKKEPLKMERTSLRARTSSVAVDSLAEAEAGEATADAGEGHKKKGSHQRSKSATGLHDVEKHA